MHEPVKDNLKKNVYAVRLMFDKYQNMRESQVKKNLLANYCPNLTALRTTVEVLLRFLIRNFLNRSLHSYLLIAVKQNYLDVGV